MLNLALISIIVIPFVLVVSIILFKKVSKSYEAYQEQEATLSTRLQENLAGVRVVKAFSRQTFEMEKFEKDNLEKYVRGKKLIIMHSLFWPLSDILCGAQMLAGYLVGALMAINGDIYCRNLPGLCGHGGVYHLSVAQPRPGDRSNLHRVGFLRPRDGYHQGIPGTAGPGRLFTLRKCSW